MRGPLEACRSRRRRGFNSHRTPLAGGWREPQFVDARKCIGRYILSAGESAPDDTGSLICHTVRMIYNAAVLTFQPFSYFKFQMKERKWRDAADRLKANIRKRSEFLPLAYVRTLGKCCNGRRQSQGEASVRNSSSDFDGASMMMKKLKARSETSKHLG